MKQLIAAAILVCGTLAFVPVVHAAAPASGALTAAQAAQQCPLAPGQSGSVQLFDNTGGDAYYLVSGCGDLVRLVVQVNYVSRNNTDIYFTGVGAILP
jgi:hypothetical protein